MRGGRRNCGERTSMSSTTQAIEAVTIAVATPIQLRDYFLRLGAEATVASPHEVHVRLAQTGKDDDSIADHLRHWVTRNGIPAMIGGSAQGPIGSDTYFLERPRLGDMLLRRGLITQEQLSEALAESRASGDLLGRVMIQRRFIFEDELARTVADQLDLPYVNLRVTGFDRSVAQMLPSHEGMRMAALPIGVLGGRIRVVFADPSDEDAKAIARQHIGDFTLAVADLSDIELAWRALDPTCGFARTA
jgi:hypothetical protein